MSDTSAAPERPASERRPLADLGPSELSDALAELDPAGYRVGQVARWVYHKDADSFDAMSDLPAGLRATLAGRYRLPRLAISERRRSRDGTEKWLFGLEDGESVETVLIPAKGRRTVCVSTQVGCRFRCGFCASGLLGLTRHLSAWEILGQVQALRREGAPPTHVVFMGIGEPFDNYDRLLTAIRVLNWKDGMGMGARRLTVSTTGVVTGIRKLAAEGLQVELSISLHAPDDETRSRLMPVNRKWPVEEVLAACRAYVAATGRQITFEYILLPGVNDRSEQADLLARRTRGLPCHVNLIPYNRVPEFPWDVPEPGQVRAFRDRLRDAGVSATIRVSRGRDISAACGQLRLEATRSRTR